MVALTKEIHYLMHMILAEGVGFEPTERLHVRQFSRLQA
jgi:hypothetical protein